MGTVSRVGDVRAPLGVCRLLLLESSNLHEGFHGALYLLVVPGLLREVYLYLHLGISLASHTLIKSQVRKLLEHVSKLEQNAPRWKGPHGAQSPTAGSAQHHPKIRPTGQLMRDARGHSSGTRRGKTSAGSQHTGETRGNLR